MRQPIQVLIHPVRRASGQKWEYLLLRRTPERGAFWQGPSGGVEEGESITEAARREMIEETGLLPLTLEQVDLSYSFPVEDNWRHLFAPGTKTITEYIFIAKVAEKQKPTLSHEHVDYKWCEFEEALALLRFAPWPDLEETLKRCHEVVLARRL